MEHKIPIAPSLAVFMSNSTERLLLRLKENLVKAPPDPFYRVKVLVPDVYSKSFLQIELAKAFGICLRVEVQTLPQFFGFQPFSFYLAAAYKQHSKKPIAHTLAKKLAQEENFCPKSPIEADEVHLFAISSLSSGLHQAFVTACSKIAVTYYVLSPCMLFWADIFSDKEAKRLSKVIPKELLYNRSKLLANYAQAGREFAALLEDAKIEEEYVCKEWVMHDPCYSQYVRPEAVAERQALEPSLLDAIQADMLLLGPKRPNSLGDGSFQVHKAPTPWREVEILYQQIQKEPLFATSRIAIFAPDIELYRPYIKGLFGQSSQILGSESSFVEGFWHTFELVFQPYLPKCLFSLFQCPSLRKKFAVEAEDLATLSSCLKRVDLSDAHNLAINWMCEMELSCQEAALLGKCLAAYKALKRDLESIRSKMALHDWLKLFRKILENYFEPSSDLLRIKEALLRAVDYPSDAIEFHEARDVVNEAYKELCNEAGALLYAPIVCATIGQLRAVPCEMICLLGMNEGAIVSDKTLLIELLLSCRKKLFISYQEEPARIVQELIDIAGVGDLTVTHPLDSCSEAQGEIISNDDKGLVSVVHEVPEQLFVHELMQAVKNPLRSYFQKGLGLYLKDYEPRVAANEFEVLEAFTTKQLVQKAFLLPQNEQEAFLATSYHALPTMLKAITIDSVQEELLLLQQNSKILQIGPQELLRIEFSPFCAEPYQQNGKCTVPAPKFEIEGRELLLCGTLENVHPHGLVSFATKSKEAVFRHLAEVLLLPSELGIEPAILFVKEGKKECIAIEKPQELLKKFVEFAIACRKTPLWLPPEHIQDPKMALKLEQRDPYSALFFSKLTNESLNEAWPIWQSWAKILFGALL